MYSKIFRKAIFPAMEAYQGTSIQKKLEFLNKSQWWTREEIDDHQNRKLMELVRHAYENVPYYHRLFKENNLKPEEIKTKEDMHKIPYLTKDIIRKNLPDLMAKNIPRNQLMQCHSSGSTGEPLKFYITKDAYSWGWAQTFRCWGWAGYGIGDKYIKMSLNPRSGMKKKVQDLWMNCIYIYAFDINEKTLEDYIKKINSSKAKLMRGYASSMYLLAKYIEEKKGSVHGLDALMTTGDTLFPHYRDTIENQFNCKIFDGYGGESTPVAFECEKHEGYHLCEDTVYTEFIAPNKDIGGSGGLREIVFTNLNNLSIPLIRYKIKDMCLPLDKRCSCGRNLDLISKIAGRDTDIVVTPLGGFIIVHFFTALFEYIEGVDQFQVTQEKIDELRIRIVKNEKFTQENLEYIKNEIHKVTGKEMTLDIEYVDSIPLTKSGKRRFVISTVPIEF